MKKIFGLLLFTMLCISLTACGGNKMLTRKSIEEKQVLEINGVKVELNKTTFGEIKDKMEIENYDFFDGYIGGSYVEVNVLSIDEMKIDEKEERIIFSMVTPVMSGVHDNIDDYIITGFDIKLLENSKYNIAINGVDFKFGPDVNDETVLSEDAVIEIEDAKYVCFDTFYNKGWYIGCYNLTSPYSGFGEREYTYHVVDNNLYDIKYSEEDTDEPKLDEVKINGKIYDFNYMTIRDLLEEEYFFIPINKYRDSSFILEDDDFDIVELGIISKDNALYTMSVSVVNHSGDDLNIIDCKICSVTVDMIDLDNTETDCNLEFTNGFKFENKDILEEDVIKIFGEPSTVYEYTSSKDYYYHPDYRNPEYEDSGMLTLSIRESEREEFLVKEIQLFYRGYDEED